MLLGDPIVAAAACLGVFIAGVSKAGFGSGASFVAAPMLASFLDPATTLAVLLPVLMVIDAASLRPYWKRWDRTAALLLCLGALPGVAIGAAVYRLSDPDAIRLLIGAIALSFLAFQLARHAGWLSHATGQAPRWVGLMTGTVAGFTSFISHAGGPPVTVYLLYRKLTKTAFQATTVVVFAAVNVAKAGPYAVLGLFDAQTLWSSLALVPVALAGAWVGVKAHRHVPEALFFTLTYALLAMAGAKLVHDALT